MKGKSLTGGIFALAALLFGVGAAAATEPPTPAYSPEAQAVREAAALKTEGSRLYEEGHPGEAREKWLAAVEAYQRSGYKPGESEVLLKLGVSYQPEMMSDPEKMVLMFDYMRRGALVAAEFLDDLARKAEPADREPYKEADALLRRASDLAQSGDCAGALPVFEQAGQSYEKAAFPAGELRSLIGRLRCQPKGGDPLSAMSSLTILPEFDRVAKALKDKVKAGASLRYLRAVEDAELGQWKEAETLLRAVLQEFEAAGESANAARAAIDLGCVLAQTGRAGEAEPLFRRAQELLAGREDSDSRRNQAAALQNLAGLHSATEKPAAPGEDAKQNQGKLVPPEVVTPSLPPGEEVSSGPILAGNAHAQAQRRAVFLLGEGDRLQQAGNLKQAREKWKAAVEAYKQAADGLGEAEAYHRLANSYLAGGMTDSQQFSLALDYFLQAATAGTAVYETLIRKQMSFDEEAIGKANTLFEEAQELARSSDYARALPLLAEARNLYHVAGFASGEARSLLVRATCQAKAGDFLGALNSALEAISIAESLPMGDSTSELAVKAEDLFRHGRWQESLAAFQELLCRYEEAKDLAGIAGAHLNLGVVEEALGHYVESENDLREALRLLPQVGDEYSRSNEAAVHHNLGSLLAILGRADEAAEELRAARALWRETGEPIKEIAALSATVVALSQGGDLAAALATLDEAEDLQQHLPPEPEIEGDLLNNRAVVYFHQGRHPEALDLFQRALVLRQQLPQRQKEAETLINVSLVQTDQGRFDEALAALHQVEEIARRQGSAELAAKASLSVAGLYAQRGNYQEGIRIYLGILTKATERGELAVETVVHTCLGASYLRLGDLPNAQVHLTRALEVSRQTGNPDGVASALLDLGGIRLRTGDLAGAEANFAEARRIWSDLGNRLAVGRALANLSALASQRGDPGEGLKEIEQAREQIRDLGAREDEERLLLLAGGLHLRRGDPAKALDSLRPAVDLAGRIGDPVGELAARAFTAVARVLQGDLTAAVSDLDGTMALLDRWGAAITVSELKSTFLDQFFDFFAIGVLLNFQVNRPAEAFRYAEQARARAFLDQIANQRLTPGRGSDPELVRQEQDLRARLVSFRDALHAENEKPLAQQKGYLLSSRRSALEDTEKSYAALLTHLKLANPEYAALISVNTLSLPEVQQQVLDEQTTLIEYFVPNSQTSEEGTSRVFAWVIDRDRFTMVQLPVTSGDLRSRITELRDLIENRQSVALQSTELYRDLFAPLAPHIRHRNLVIVPHGALHFLPFAALWDEKGRHYLGDSYALSYAPSATSLKFARQRKARVAGPVLVAGDPDGSLPQAAVEARAVSRLFGGEPLIGRSATKEAVVARAGQTGILHLAAHAVLNPVNPLFSRIELARDGGHDGNLEMHEVFGLDLSKTGLVVLSACSTQMGKLSAGDELEGLTRAFLYAGTPAVVSSLWEVNDESTSFFMQRFYTHLRKGAGRAEALRLAQMETRRKFPHPYQWAAFVLTGDGR